MEISIDESIENLVLLKKLEDSLGNISGNTNSVASQSLGCALDTMRKYQKIEQIIHDDWIKGVNSGATLNRIEEVMKDGKSGN
jgi:phosphoribosyl-AMP cyclohydrolase